MRKSAVAEAIQVSLVYGTINVWALFGEGH